MRRRLRQIAILLLLGAVINVAVAWTCSLRSNKQFACSATANADERDQFGELNWPNVIIHSFEYAGFGINQRRFDYKFGGDLILPGQGNLLIRTDAGWPFRSLTGFCRKHSDLIDAWRAPPGLQRQCGLWKREIDAWLPLGPIWPGFAVNTLLYGAIVWLLFAAPFQLRRWRRRRRGLCLKCGYDLRGAAHERCPECGAAVE